MIAARAEIVGLRRLSAGASRTDEKLVIARTGAAARSMIEIQICAINLSAAGTKSFL